MAELTVPKSRIQSIDLLRGIVIVIMALDHVRDFFHTSGLQDPTNMQTTTPLLFLTRWITHFCAPSFVFLAGTSGFLQGLRKTKKELSLFLIKRGLWLVFAEVVLITLAITFDPGYHFIILQVIWAIGISMIILGLLVWLPLPVIFFYGFVIVFFHNALDPIEAARRAAGEQGSLVWRFLHNSFFFEPLNPPKTDRAILGIYSIGAWSGVMALGYCFGKLFDPVMDPARRRKLLIYIGLGLTALFVVLRWVNTYGNPFPWSDQPRGPVYTILSFFNTNKYPPSLQYLCMTLGPAILFLAFIEKVQNRVAGFFITFGRVPFFFYILHFYLIHIICAICFYIEGYGKDDIISKGGSPFRFRPDDFGYPLWASYIIWIAVILMLYPLCRKYDRYKTTKKKWWTSYL